MAKTYTIDELLVLPDDEINALAAELRGWSLGKNQPWAREAKTVWCDVYNESDGAAMPVDDWMPCTDRNQSGELLIWALDRDVEFVNTRTDEFPMQQIINARVETIAFCAAMLAIQETK